jgi:hypothetical protein
MKMNIKTSVLLLALGVANPLKADVLTFDTGPLNGTTVPRNLGNGITTTIGPTFSTVGGGHYWLNGWNNDDIMTFVNPTHVNSFDMTARRWLGDSLAPTGYKIDVAAFNSSNAKIWSQTIDLTGTTWNNWTTINVDTYDVSKMIFYAPNQTQHNQLSPSLDNLTINVEPPPVQELAVTATVPDASGSLMVLLMGLGTLTFFRKTEKRATSL